MTPENACARCTQDCDHLTDAWTCPAIVAAAVEDLALEEA